MSDKEILSNANELLNDKHISTVCSIALVGTLLQHRKATPLEPNLLQIIHFPGHWIAASTMNLATWRHNWALSTKISDDSTPILTQLVHTRIPFPGQQALLSNEVAGKLNTRWIGPWMVVEI